MIVLLTLSLLLTVAGQFALAMRLEGTTTVNFRGATTARFLAEAAYHRALVEILAETIAPGLPGQVSSAAAPKPVLPTLMVQLDERGTLVFRRSRLTTPQAPEREIPLGPGRLSYRITDEESRIGLNQPITPQFSELLHALLSELGVERAARDVVVDSILDWRDPNEEHRLNGAESDDYYLGLPVPYRSKNADFDSVDELLQVRGVTREILYGRPESPGLAEFVTAALPAGSGVNLNTATPTVLRALGCAPAQVESLVANRPYLQPADFKTQCQWRLPTQQRLFRSQTFRIEATGEVPGQGRRTLEATVRREPKDGVARVVRKTWRWIEEERTP